MPTYILESEARGRQLQAGLLTDWLCVLRVLGHKDELRPFPTNTCYEHPCCATLLSYVEQKQPAMLQMPTGCRKRLRLKSLPAGRLLSLPPQATPGHGITQVLPALLQAQWRGGEMEWEKRRNKISVSPCLTLDWRTNLPSSVKRLTAKWKRATRCKFKSPKTPKRHNYNYCWGKLFKTKNTFPLTIKISFHCFFLELSVNNLWW